MDTDLLENVAMAPVTGLLAAQKSLAERHLMDFVRLMWHVVEPSTDMVEGRVLEAICEHLEAVAEGRIHHLIINVPPGTMKSLITNVFFPAWIWGPFQWPAARFLTAAYSAALTERDNERCARVMKSPLYRLLWGDIVQLERDGMAKITTRQTGWKFASSTRGTITGERGDFILIDDANDPNSVESRDVRLKAVTWIREIMPTRLNDPATGRIVNIQQRTHEEDATGTLLDMWDAYDHLMLPMRYDPERHCTTSIGFSDWRKEADELLWPERFTLAVVIGYDKMGPYAVASQMQQAPVPRGGGIIKRDWWRPWEAKESPPLDFVLASLDTAVKEKEQDDYYALTIWGVWHDPDDDSPRLILLNAWKRRGELHEIVNDVVASCRKLKVDQLVIEDKAHGWVAQQEIRRLSGKSWKFGIAMFDPTRYGDKMARLISVQHIFSEGLVFAPVAEDEFGNVNFRKWADEVIQEVSSFPKATHDDLTDTVSMAVRFLRDIGFVLNREEHREAEPVAMEHKSRQLALYDV